MFSFAINKDIKLLEVLNEDSIQNLFLLPPSEEAFIQFTELELVLQTMHNNYDPDN
jgi:hypothetical protein